MNGGQEKQVEIDKLTAVLSAGEEGGSAPHVQRVFLPPLGPKAMEDAEVLKNLQFSLGAKFILDELFFC